ncbi:MAG: hypothetical protein JSS15_10570 [Proteobacteria bacterium]|nr:hypothetical protein [Pseudomonadota bacterium]
MKLGSKVMIALAALQGCSAPDITLDAKRCIAKQLAHQKVSTSLDRDAVAGKCARYIERWAVLSTQKAYGADSKLSEPKIREEYLARKQAIISILIPLDGDPQHM